MTTTTTITTTNDMQFTRNKRSCHLGKAVSVGVPYHPLKYGVVQGSNLGTLLLTQYIIFSNVVLVLYMNLALFTTTCQIDLFFVNCS